MRVIVAGSTGLVGQACVELLLRTEAVTQVVALVRRPWAEAPESPQLMVLSVDYDDFSSAPAALLHADAVICALGTTMRTAGSREAFRQVDHDYPLALAQATRRLGARHFLLVSAVGASPNARAFYTRIKGQTEDAIRAVDFPSTTIARPSFLAGPRRELRMGEVAGRALARLAPERWKPVHVKQIAHAFADAILRARPGVEVLENARLRTFPA